VQADPSEDNKSAAQGFSTKIYEWRRRSLRFSLDDVPIEGFRRHILDVIPPDTFAPQETAALRTLADRMADLFEASKNKGGYTEETAEFYDKYNDGSGVALYKVAFNVQ
jgi:hypothetical protein